LLGQVCVNRSAFTGNFCINLGYRPNFRSWNTCCNHVGGNHGFSLNDSSFRYNCALPDIGKVRNRGIHSNQRTSVDYAIVKHRGVTDGDIFLDDGLAGRTCVNRDVLLHCSPRANDNRAKIPAENRPATDIDIRANDDLARDIGGWVNPRGRVNFWKSCAKCIYSRESFTLIDLTIL